MTDERADDQANVRGVPLFCPRCAKRFAGGSRHCPDCSTRLVVQGFCTVCHASWPIPPGRPCPKHEIELISEPPDPPFTRPDVAGESWVKVAAFARPFEAEAARIRLDAEGIPAILEGHRTNTAYAGQFATGGSRLLVPEVYVQDARILLAQSWDAAAALADDAIAGEDDLEDLDDQEPAEEPSAPAPPAQGDRSAASIVLWLVLLILGPLILALIQFL